LTEKKNASPEKNPVPDTDGVAATTTNVYAQS